MKTISKIKENQIEIKNQKIKIGQNKIIDNLVDKLCKKVNFNDNESSLKKISTTRIFKQLMVKLDHDQLPLLKNEKDDFDKNAINNHNNIEEDLPRFGATNKKIIDANRYDSQGKERMKSDKLNVNKSHSIDELNHDHSLNSIKKQEKKAVSTQNPNNTMTKNESQNDDSLFKGIIDFILVDSEERIINKYCPDENLENILNPNVKIS